MEGFDFSCVAHVHSTYSDGTATVPELLAAARDALLLTDHDSLAARRDGWEGWHDGAFLLVGTEVSAKQGHYLAFGVETEIPHAGRSALEIAAAVRSPARGCDGIELWSLTTDAAEAWRTPAEAVSWLRDPEAAVALGRRCATSAAGTRCPLAAGSRRSAAWTPTRPASGSAGACACRSPTREPSRSCARTWSADARWPATRPPSARRASRALGRRGGLLPVAQERRDRAEDGHAD